MSQPIIQRPSPADIEAQAHYLRILLDGAAQTISQYEADIAPIRDRYAAHIRRHATAINEQRAILINLLNAAPTNLWGKTKTKIVHGIKVGWRKVADKWAWPTDEALVAAIQTHCTPEQQAAYLVTTTVGRKDAIPPEVRRDVLGIRLTPGTDAPVVDDANADTITALMGLLSQIDPDAKP